MITEVDEKNVDLLLQRSAEKKAELERLRSRAPDGLANFDSRDIELTDTSNAIQGNTFTAVEMTLVVKKGITGGSKPLKDHLEAVDHSAALGYARAGATGRRVHGNGRAQPAPAGHATLGSRARRTLC